MAQMTPILIANCRYSAIAVLLLAVASVRATAGVDPDESSRQSCIVDVGVEGACLYGNWLSGRVVLRLEECNVFLDGFFVYPGFDGVGTTTPDSLCAGHMIRRARGCYEYLQDVFAHGRLYLVGPGITQNIAPNTRASQQFLGEIAEARARKTPITNENWGSSNILLSAMAELIRRPIPVEECGGF